MNFAEIDKLSVEELQAQLAQAQEQLTRLKIAHAVSPIENPMRIREARKHVARLKTALSGK
jgi:large subunit ribosomal protein L29